MPDATSITVKIDNQNPVELIDFTRSLLALGDQFKREVESDENFEGKLYVKELRQGSLVAVLEIVAAHGPAVAGSLAAANTFLTNLKAAVHWLRSGTDKPEKVDPKTVRNISNILEPIAKDQASSISINISGDINQPVTIAPVITVNTTEANAVQNRAARYLAAERMPDTNLHRKVLMAWAVVKNEGGTPTSGEKATIDSLSDRAVKVVFDSRALREEMLQGQANPLKEAFIVDVETQTVRGRLASYKVLQLHERIRLDDEAEATATATAVAEAEAEPSPAAEAAPQYEAADDEPEDYLTNP